MQTGVVDTIIDGDTFTLTTDEIIRLANVNAPEEDSPNAAKTREKLNDLIGNKYIKYNEVAKDTYGRIVAEVYVNSTYVNDEMRKYISLL